MLFFLFLSLVSCITPTINERTPVVLERRDTGHAVTGAIASGIVGYNYKTENPVKVIDEAAKIMDQWWDLFYDPKAGKMFDGTPICNTDIPQAWALTVALQSLADGCLRLNNKYTNRIEIVYNLLEKYYNSDLKAYAVTTTDHTNIDTDDNAQVVYALLDCYRVTGDKKYLERSKDICDFLMTQWDPTWGGEIWEMNNGYIAAISTSETAQALTKLYGFVKNETYVEYSEKLMHWEYEHLWKNDTNLISDGMGHDGKVDTAALSYHVGTAMSACIALHKITNNEFYLTLAEKLSQAAIDRNLSIFETGFDYNIRWWNNHISYSQLLFLGLRDYYLNVSNDNVFFNELTRQGRLLYDFGRGTDGLYFRDVAPLSNSDKTYNLLHSVTGATGKNIDTSQWCHNDMTQSPQRWLIYQASAAKIFFFLSDITTDI